MVLPYTWTVVLLPLVCPSSCTQMVDSVQRFLLMLVRVHLPVCPRIFLMQRLVLPALGTAGGSLEVTRR